MRTFIQKKIAFVLLIPTLFVLAACSMDAMISDIISSTDTSVDGQRTDVDFTSSEIVTTGNGVVFSGSFGEVSEKKVLANGVTFDGVFYE